MYHASCGLNYGISLANDNSRWPVVKCKFVTWMSSSMRKFVLNYNNSTVSFRKLELSWSKFCLWSEVQNQVKLKDKEIHKTHCRSLSNSGLVFKPIAESLVWFDRTEWSSTNTSKYSQPSLIFWQTVKIEILIVN